MNQLRTLAFKPDGTRMFIGGMENHKLRQYDLANPFDLRSGVTPGGTSDSLESADSNMRNIQFFCYLVYSFFHILIFQYKVFYC